MCSVDRDYKATRTLGTGNLKGQGLQVGGIQTSTSTDVES